MSHFEQKETGLARGPFYLFSELLFQALLLGKDGLAQAQGLGSDFEELVVADEFHALFEGEDGRRDEAERFVRAGGAGVGQVLRLADVANANADDEIKGVDVAKAAFVKAVAEFKADVAAANASITAATDAAAALAAAVKGASIFN